MAHMLKNPSWRWTSIQSPPRKKAVDKTHKNMRHPRLAPAWLKHEKQVLRFYGYFQEAVVERWDENSRFRYIVICFYMEDGTVSVDEPKVENSGIVQGKFLKRQQVERSDQSGFAGPGDFRVGEDITFYGITYHVTGCDRFTRWFYKENGVELAPDEEMPKDLWAKTYQFQKVCEKGGLPLSRSAVEAKLQNKYQCGQPPADLRLVQFLQNDRKVLRFKAYWDDPTPYGNRLYFTVHYYLADSTVEINEAHARNSGRDKYPVFYKRGPLYKEDRVNVYPGMLEAEKVPYDPGDMLVGSSVKVWGRKIVIYNCDDFTQKFYEEHLGIDQRAKAIDVSLPPKIHQALCPPPHNGIGYPEDALENCLAIRPKAAKQDLERLLSQSGQIVRFEARLVNSEPEDENRKFVISYYLADDHVAVYEEPVRNSGHMGGKFAEKKRTVNPATGKYFQLHEFAIGNIVVLAAQPFHITRADERTLRFLESQPERFEYADPIACARRLAPLADLPQMQGQLDPDELKAIAEDNGIPLLDHEVVTLLRHLGEDAEDGRPQISGPGLLEVLAEVNRPVEALEVADVEDDEVP